MTLRKAWQSLDRSTVNRAPDNYGYYEFGDDGEVIDRDWGIVRSALKEELAYGEATEVRWEAAQHRDHARRLFEEHADQ